jgi:DNA repair photolyase
MVAMDDMTRAVSTGLAIRINLQRQDVRVLFRQRDSGVDAGMHVDPMLIGVDHRKSCEEVDMLARDNARIVGEDLARMRAHLKRGMAVAMERLAPSIATNRARAAFRSSRP